MKLTRQKSNMISLANINVSEVVAHYLGYYHLNRKGLLNIDRMLYTCVIIMT